MISAPVRVISAADGIAQVEPTETSGCGGCASRSSCGVSGLGKYFSSHRKAIAVQCDANVRAGDELHLSLSEGDLLKAGMMAYLLPSVLALVGAGIAAALGWGDVGAVFGAAAGIVLGFLLGRLTGWVPQMVAQTKNELSKGETP
jgi:sigma-E factor negative regulatory protein RseC